MKIVVIWRQWRRLVLRIPLRRDESTRLDRARTDLPSGAVAPMTAQSVQSQVADADADLGPGQCEPSVVGSQ